MNSRAEERLVEDGEDFFEAFVAVTEGQYRGERFYIPTKSSFGDGIIEADYAKKIRRVNSYLNNLEASAAA